MNFLNRFVDENGILNIDGDWEEPDAKRVYAEILWELEQYGDDGTVRDDFIVLHDKTVYQILVLLKQKINSDFAENDAINDLSELALKRKTKENQ